VSARFGFARTRALGRERDRGVGKRAGAHVRAMVRARAAARSAAALGRCIARAARAQSARAATAAQEKQDPHLGPVARPARSPGCRAPSLPGAPARARAAPSAPGPAAAARRRYSFHALHNSRGSANPMAANDRHLNSLCAALAQKEVPGSVWQQLPEMTARDLCVAQVRPAHATDARCQMPQRERRRGPLPLRRAPREAATWLWNQPTAGLMSHSPPPCVCRRCWRTRSSSARARATTLAARN
jgi:hypothetical protein